ncbi:hypothetical protein GOP47_0020099 [Adiantum capillus-veneris]|uniref:Uncharacterized protein n=1 Tax=Adiantum capillus-veneris TaxID=13818 RepID=A0A9D4UCB7_ADICA|nr:hypothetical protein GOP47_0020099 [Adiantum capillus-veneris]
MTRIKFHGTATAREKARKSTTFPRGEKEIDIEAAVLMNALCKPWEMGGHPHDFYVAHRSARITDATQYYERDTANIKKHERMVADKVVWSRQRAIREEMLQLLTRLHSIERQRRHFNAVRVQKHGEDNEVTAKSLKPARPVYEHDVNANLQILSSSFVDDGDFPQYIDVYPPHRPSSAMGRFLSPMGQDSNAPKHALTSPSTVAEKKAVEDLDTFEVQIAAPIKQKQAGAPGSAVSFGKGKRK